MISKFVPAALAAALLALPAAAQLSPAEQRIPAAVEAGTDDVEALSLIHI